MPSAMNLFHVRRPSETALRALLSEQSGCEVTYAEVGRTLGLLPAGYHHLRAERTVGAGPDTMERGRSAIRSWAAQDELGLVLEPRTPALVAGTVLVFALPLRPSPMWATGACRVVKMVDEPRRFGFVYGTLPHHPEIGEEAFLVHHDDDDGVRFSITAFSRAGALPMRLAGPAGRFIQRFAARTYLDGYERATVGR